MAATRIVQNTVQLPGTNRPYALRNVSIRLNVPSFIDGGVTEKIRTTTVTTDSTGTWSAALEVNAGITPANTYYTVREASGVVWTIVVPAGDPAVPVNLFDCLVTAPTNPTPIVAPDVGGIIDAMYGLPNGLPGPLNGSGKLPASQVPASSGSDSSALHQSNNLSDVANPVTALANLNGASVDDNTTAQGLALLGALGIFGG